MIRAVLLSASTLLALAVGAGALAQERPDPLRDRPDSLRDRTGPGSTGPALPAYSQPTPPLIPLVEAPVSVATGDERGVLLSGIALTGDTETAIAAIGWVPERDAVAGLALDRPGTTGFDVDWIERQFVQNALVGTRVPLDRITGLVQLINLAFVRNGYISSGVRIARGEISNGGVLRLERVAGRTAVRDGGEAVTLAWGSEGSRGLSPEYISARMQPARAVPLNAIAVERAFRLLAENAAIDTIRADLRPGARPGEAVLALTVDPAERFDLFASFANSRSPAVGGERAVVGGSVRNLMAAGDIFSAELGFTAGEPDLSAGYQTPIFGTHTELVLRGGYNRASVVDRPLLPLDISALDWSIEGGLNQSFVKTPLMPRPTGGWSAARTVTAGVRIAHRETETFLLGMPFSFAPGAVNGRSHYTALRLVADWVERGTQQVTALSFTLTQGLDGSRVVPANPADRITLLDRVPQTSFRAALLQASHARRLTAQGLELRLRATGQWSNGLLYSGERLAAGGEFSVRGYRETLALVDRGAIGSVELYQPFSLAPRGGGGFNPGAFGAAIFADGAVLGNASGQQPQPDELASVGVSLAWVPSEAISARVSYAEALINTRQVGSRDLQDRGFQFRLTIRPLALFRRR